MPNDPPGLPFNVSAPRDVYVTDAPKPPRTFFPRSLRVFGWLVGVPAFIWACAALWVVNPVAAAIYGVTCLTMIGWLRRRAWPKAAVLILTAAIAIGWFSLPARNDRAWTPDTAETAWAEIGGDVVTLHNYRNFEWRTETDFTPRWETRTFRLSQLRQLDFLMTYWGGATLVCHTMLTFDFGPDGRVCASIEARREQGEDYSAFAGIFRRYELVYVLGDERDVVRLRTSIRPDNDVYLFRLKAKAEVARAMFLDYLRSANALREKAKWYNTLLTNCSTTLRAHVRRASVADPWDWRVLANGYADEHLYEVGYVARDLPLYELKRRSRITTTAQQAASSPEFSNLIRIGLPGF
jgi:hypothetical protein